MIIPNKSFSHREYNTNYVNGRTLYTKAGVPYIIEEVIYEDGIKKRAKIRFYNGFSFTFTITHLGAGINYERLAINSGMDIIGKERITKYGEIYRVVRKLENNHFEVKFDNGIVRNIAKAVILKNDFRSRVRGVYIGKEYVSREGDLCKVISIDENGETVLLQRVKDKKEKVVSKSALKHARNRIIFESKEMPFRKYDIGYRGESIEGMGFEIIERKPCSKNVKIKFDNNLIKDVSVEYIAKNKISLEDKDDVRVINILGHSWQVIGKIRSNNSDRFNKIRIRNEIDEETTIGRGYMYEGSEIKRLNNKEGDIIYIDGVGLSEYLGTLKSSKSRVLMRAISEDYKYELSGESFSKKRLSKNEVYSLYKIKVINKLDRTDLFKCRCENCGMNDILSLEEMREHWRECRQK